MDSKSLSISYISIELIVNGRDFGYDKVTKERDTNQINLSLLYTGR
jgi:hypothetical protein